MANDGTGTVATHVAVRYPVDWSRKSAAIDLRPHLSTVDAILLAAQLSELFLVQAYRLDTAVRRHMWLRGIRIRAGVRPEEDLDHLDARLGVLETRPGSAGGPVSVLQVRIGAMRIQCEIEHGGGAPTATSAVHETPESLLGPADQRYYGTGFTFRSHRIEDLTVEPDDLTAGARVELGTERVPREGLEGYYQPAPTPIDCFVTSLQLGQVLLYQLDSTTRSLSNTLWMRTTALDIPVPPRRMAVSALPLVASLANARIVEMGGVAWRTADVVSRMGGVRLRCGVAHALPAGWADRS